MSLMLHNCFGLVKVTPKEIVVTVSAVTEQGKGLSRGYGIETERELLPDGCSLTATFGAYIEPGKRNRIAFHDFPALEDLPQVGEIPEVTKAVTKALDLIKTAIWTDDSEGISK